MKIFKKVTAIFLALTISLSCAYISAFSAFSASSQSLTVTSMSIVTMPKKYNYYKGNDWNYGYWSFPEGKDTGSFVAKDNLITLMYNGGKHHFYEDRGMIDLNGLVVKVTFADGTTDEIAYNETLSGSTVTPNIYASPSDEYSIGKNTIEIYFKSNTKVYTTFTINILPYKLGDVNTDGSVNSADALMVLQHVVGLIKLTDAQKVYGDMNFDSKFNSADALAILRVAVGA